MLDNQTVLAKCIGLLWRESLIPPPRDSSSDMVKTALKYVKTSENSIIIPGSFADDRTKDVISSLKDLILEMCSNPEEHEYSKEDLIERVKLACLSDEKYCDLLVNLINEELNESNLKRYITNTIKTLSNYFKSQEAISIAGKAYHDLKNMKYDPKEFNMKLDSLIGQLEPIRMNSTMKDPAIVDRVFLADKTKVASIYTEVRNRASLKTVLKLGWQDLNDMLQGGIRPGEFIVSYALPHKNKTGFSLSVFKQVALYNKSEDYGHGKKPLLLRISTEDELVHNFEYLYKNIFYNANKFGPDISNLTPEEVSEYVYNNLSVNGWNIALEKINPTLASYRTICDIILYYESLGYRIALLMIDYLAMVTTAGCVTNAPMGKDLKDMFRRVKNFTQPKGIPVWTPHQLGPEARRLANSGIPQDQFVDLIAGSGKTSGSSELDQESELELYTHLFKHGKDYYFMIRRGKHRGVPEIPDELKTVIYKFPKLLPIPDDIDEERIGMRKLPSLKSTVDSNLYDF